MEKVKTYLPLFSGFYGTIWEAKIDRSIEWELECLNNECGANVEYDDLDINYESSMKQLAIDIKYAVQSELEDLGYISDCAFEKLVSPKYYNYSNDSINVEITLSDANIEKIRNIVNSYIGDFASHVRQDTTGRSGFIPYYSFSDFITDDFMLNMDAIYDSHHLGYILEFILNIEGLTELDHIYDYVTDWMIEIENMDDLVDCELA